MRGLDVHRALALRLAQVPEGGRQVEGLVYGTGERSHVGATVTVRFEQDDRLSLPGISARAQGRRVVGVDQLRRAQAWRGGAEGHIAQQLRGHKRVQRPDPRDFAAGARGHRGRGGSPPRSSCRPPRETARWTPKPRSTAPVGPEISTQESPDDHRTASPTDRAQDIRHLGSVPRRSLARKVTVTGCARPCAAVPLANRDCEPQEAPRPRTNDSATSEATASDTLTSLDGRAGGTGLALALRPCSASRDRAASASRHGRDSSRTRGPERRRHNSIPAHRSWSCTAFAQTETCLVLALVNGSRPQSLQRSCRLMLAIRAIKSSSDGHT